MRKSIDTKLTTEILTGKVIVRKKNIGQKMQKRIPECEEKNLVTRRQKS